MDAGPVGRDKVEDARPTDGDGEETAAGKLRLSVAAESVAFRLSRTARLRSVFARRKRLMIRAVAV
jgi:hypothetical protein